ncbi:Codanin-1, partial [Geodia barretti]
MVEEQLRKLSAKRSLDGGDAFALIQLLQEQTTPILLLRSAGSSNAPSSDRRPAANAVDEDRGRIEGRRAREPPETGKGGAASRGVSPKRALFGGRSGSATVLDVNSLEEFPPMQPSVNTTCRRKEKKATKPRRITLTSMSRSTPHQTPSSHPPHFTPLPPANESWSPHPAFVGQMVTTSSAPSPLSEERKLLRKERSRQIVQRRSDSRKVDRGLKHPGRVENTQCRSTMSNATRNKSITHQAFSTGSESALLSPSRTDGALFSSHAGTVRTSTPAPATSVFSVLSVNRVSNRTSLEHLAQLHSKIITDRLVPNITSEIHFVVQLLTCTQPTHALQNISDGSENLFRTVENCVYFAVRVLYNIRNFLTALDTATLQLLSDNTRIKQLEPKLAAFLSVALERAQTDVSSRGQSHVVPQSALTNNRVPFQEDTDNLRNFPNMKVFHAFKKQRDSFYSILREWEANHNMP